MNELSKIQKKRILNLFRLGYSIRKIARETGHHHETIRRYCQNVSLNGNNKVLQQVLGESNADLLDSMENEATQSDVISGLPRSRSVCEAHRAFIETEHLKGRNAVAIYQSLVQNHGFMDSYDAVKRFVRKISIKTPKVFCRFETEPGFEAQVDYGEGAPTRNPRTGKLYKPRLFIMTLGYSRHAFQKVVEKSSTRTWCSLHEDAFAFFGGTTKIIRLDNLKEGIIRPDIYDPEINRMYAEMLEYYGVQPMPCRPYAPNLKGKVESSVAYAQGTALKGLSFDNIELQNKHLQEWNLRWAYTRKHGTTKTEVKTMFLIEQTELSPLPVKIFEYYERYERVVHIDGHIEVRGAYYSVPPRYVGKRRLQAVLNAA